MTAFRKADRPLRVDFGLSPPTVRFRPILLKNLLKNSFPSIVEKILAALGSDARLTVGGGGYMQEFGLR